MSEWLTTGQMIDQLKVGEIAEAYSHDVEGTTSKLFEVERTTRYYEPFFNRNTKNTLHLNEPLFALKWRILPKYVSFEEAMGALMNGKKIRRLNGNAWYTKFSVLEFTLDTFYKQFVKYDKWIIQEES